MAEIKNPKVIQQQEEERRWIDGILVSAQKRRWFGTIRIEIKNGMVNLLRSEETLKPPRDGN